MSLIRILRYLAFLEATSFLALLVATYIKYANDAPGGVQVLGPVHGVLFIAYVVITLAVRRGAGWTIRTTLLVLVAAVLPFGGYVADVRCLAPTERRLLARPSTSGG